MTARRSETRERVDLNAFHLAQAELDRLLAPIKAPEMEDGE